jgi:hypothetical protein
VAQVSAYIDLAVDRLGGLCRIGIDELSTSAGTAT